MPITELSQVIAALQAGTLDQALGVAGPGLLRAAIRRQADSLRPPLPAGDPGYALRQLCLQVGEFGAVDLAAELRNRLLALPRPALVPEWTTRRVTTAVTAELPVTDSWVTALAALPDGQVACADFSGRLGVLDLTGPGRGPRPFGDHPRVTALAALPGGRVVSMGEGPLRIWDPAVPGTAPLSLPGSQNASAVAALPDGRVVSSAGYALVWDPRAPAEGPVAVADHDGPVMVVAALPDGRVAYAGGGRGLVRVWDPAAGGGHGPVELAGHDGWIRAVAALPDGRVVSAGADTRVLLHDPAAPGRPSTGLGLHELVAGLAVLSDGRVVSFGGGLLRVWDPGLPGHPVAEVAGADGNDSVIAGLADGRMATGTGDGRVRVWDLSVAGGAPLAAASLGGYAAGTFAVAAWPDGRAAVGGPGERIRVLGPAAPSPGSAGPYIVEYLGQAPEVFALTVLPDGRVAGGCSDGALRVWNPAMPGSPLAFRDRSARPSEPDGPEAFPVRLGRTDPAVFALAALPDGRIVSGGTDGRVLLWSLAAPDVVPTLLGRHDGPVRAVAALSGDVAVSAGDDGLIRVWNPSGRVAEFAPPGRTVRQVTALPGGRLVTGASDGRLQVLESGTGHVAAELGQHDRLVVAVAALQDGRVISADEGQLRLWDVARTAETARVSCSVRALAVARARAGSPPDAAPAHRLVIAHQVQGVSLWSVPAG